MVNALADFILSRRLGIPRSELRFARALAARPLVTKCDAILDVGANQGMFSTAMAWATKTLPVHAFEPLPNLQSRLRSRLAPFPQAKVHACGLGAIAGQATLHYGEFHEASSLLPMDQLHQVYFPGSKPTERVLVPISTLDAFFQKHPELNRVFLKLDVQGFELEVMKGGENSLFKIQAAMVEISFEQLYQGGASAEQVLLYFLNRGYQAAGFVRPLRARGQEFPVSGDFLFTRSD